MNISGLLFNYYIACPRRLWFYAHRITMEHEEELVKIGKYIELFYKEENKKEKRILIDEKISPDFIEKNKDFIVVFEIKKSSKLKEAALWQLKYYLYYLKNKGLNAKGKLIIPEENKEEYVELSEYDIKKIEEMIKNIKEIIKLDNPPRVIKKPYCKVCSYRYICWDDL